MIPELCADLKATLVSFDQNFSVDNQWHSCYFLHPLCLARANGKYLNYYNI